MMPGAAARAVACIARALCSAAVPSECRSRVKIACSIVDVMVGQSLHHSLKYGLVDLVWFIPAVEPTDLGRSDMSATITEMSQCSGGAMGSAGRNVVLLSAGSLTNPPKMLRAADALA